MPKRKSTDDKIQRYLRKIRRLEKRRSRRRSRSLSQSDESNKEIHEIHTDIDLSPKQRRGEESDSDKENNTVIENTQIVDPCTTEPSLDSETLLALGDPFTEKPKYGAAINIDLAKRWTTLLKCGLEKESKEELAKNYIVPENCPLLAPPKLNAEILATITDNIKNRDKKIKYEQLQLGQGITAINRALDQLVTKQFDRLSLIKTLSDACKLLSDLHYVQTISRKKLITPILDKKFLDLVKDVERDEFLYGGDLSDKIKAMKYAQKSGHSIKKPENPKPPKRMGNPGSYTGNFNGPPRAKYYNRSGPKRSTAAHQDRSANYKHTMKPTKKVETKTSARK